VKNNTSPRRRGLRVSAATAALLLAGLVTSGCELVRGDSPSGPSAVGPPAPASALHYTAIGASDANGAGSSVPCPPFAACEDGRGYVPVLVRQLRATREVTVMNLGMPAAVLGPATEALARQLGREVSGNFVDRQMPFVPRDSTLVTVFAGVNDVNIIAESIEQGLAGADVQGYIDSHARTFGADYSRVINGIRARAPATFIIVMNVPNVAAMPFASRYPAEHRRIMQTISVAFSREANRQERSGVVILDTMCSPASYDPALFSRDGLHPNDAGHAELARRLKAIVDGERSSAAASCATMTAVS